VRFGVSFTTGRDDGELQIVTSCEFDVETIEEAFAQGAEFQALSIAALRGAGQEAEEIEGR
jgi:hypothetical protein